MSEYEPGNVELHGVNWPWMVTKGALDTLKNYDVWDDDVWVTTYPKAGTHWVLEIASLILVDGHEEKVNRKQQSAPVEFDLNQPGRKVMGVARSSPPQYELMKEWEAPRLIMTHLTEELMPAQIYQGKGKVIYVIRNPKDTTVSNWNFVRPMKFSPNYDEWDSFVEASFKDNMVFGTWFDHVLNFWKKHRYDKNFLFIKYEDIKQDTKGAIIQIADFLGKNLTEDAIGRVMEFSSMKSMKERAAKQKANRPGKESSTKAAPISGSTAGSNPSSDSKKGGPVFFRKGIVGDWRSKFTVAQSETLDKLYDEKMAGSGLTVQF